MSVRRNTARRAFTLLEMMVVLVIIGLLAGVVAINLVGQADNAKAEATRQRMNTIRGAVSQYYIQYSEYPQSLQQLAGLNLVVADKLVDAWNQPLYYMAPAPSGQPYVLISFGKNKQDDGGAGDDIYVYPENQ